MFPSISKRRIRAIVVREFNEIIRDPRYLTLALVVPPILVIIFGYGIRRDFDHLPLGVLDEDDTNLSRRYVDAFIQSESFDLARRYRTERELIHDLRDSKIRAALIIPVQFQRRFYHRRNTTAQIVIDGTMPSRGQIARSYAEAIHASFLERLIRQTDPRATIQTGGVAMDYNILYNPDLKSTNFIVPGLIASALMFYPALLTTLSVVREKASQSIVALYCSPITRTELLLGKVLPYLVISLVNFVSVTLVALYLFHIPFRGSWSLLIVGSVIYVFTTCGLGLVVSILINSQTAAVLVTMMLTILPSFLYSGFFTPLSVVDTTAWVISRLIPATYYLEMLKGVFLKGTGWTAHWGSLAMLVIYAAAVYAVSFTFFKKQLS